MNSLDGHVQPMTFGNMRVNSGQRSILASGRLSAYDPKQTRRPYCVLPLANATLRADRKPELMHDNGAHLEYCAQRYFAESEGIHLERPFRLEIGATKHKKLHKFDLGSDAHFVLVECKSHTWTLGGNSPSACRTMW